MNQIPKIIAELLNALHLEYQLPQTEGQAETPRRVARFWKEYLVGATADPAKILKATFAVGAYTGPVVVDGIQFASICEHHLLPFVGTATVAYLPSDRIVGLSKIPRLVDALSRKPQTQEALTEAIVRGMQVLNPRGVRVEVTAEHMCMTMRGIQARGTTTTTRMAIGEPV